MPDARRSGQGNGMALPKTTILLPILRTSLRIIAVLAIGYALHLMLSWALANTDGPLDGRSGARIGLLLVMLLIYTLMLAIPFMPGVEVGLALLAMEGAWIAPFVYTATVSGLTLAFLVGRHLPYRYLHRIFADLGLRRACDLIETLDPMTGAERLDLLRARLPGFLAGKSLGWRYLLFAVLLNIPGNSVLGGGGGIALVAGLSGIFARRLTFLIIVLAVAPVPLIIWLMGMEALL